MDPAGVSLDALLHNLSLVSVHFPEEDVPPEYT
jgi:hypothetical protein